MLPVRPPDPPASRIDVAAFVLLVCGLLVALCIFGADPNELSQSWPEQSAHTTHMFGPMGAAIARDLFDGLGAAVYVLLAAWFVLVVLLFLRQTWWTWARRLAGWLLLLPCAAVLADWIGHSTLGGLIPGSGGTLGAWIAVSLSEQLPVFLRGVVVGLAVVLGLILAFDRHLLFIARAIGRVSQSVGQCIRRVTWRWRQPKPVKPIVTIKPMQRPREVPLPGVKITHSHLINKPVVEEPADELHMDEASTSEDYMLPPISLLDDPTPFPYEEQDQRLRERAVLLERTFTDFGLNVKVVGINTGPVITQYEIALETGLRVNKVTNLADDLALNLRVPSVRIVAPIPGKNTVGIEVPNEHRANVRLKELLHGSSPKSTKARLPLFLGKDSEGRPLTYDLAEMPHLLIAGRTGTGKSVCLNAVILSLLMTRTPEECKLILIDPKMLELSEYAKIPHLMHPVVKDMKKAEAILSWAVEKMEERYDILSRARVRGIAGYNELTPEEIHRRVQPVDEEEAKRLIHPMPYIVIVIDEMGDLMMMMKKEVEAHVIRLAQKSRAAGIHLILATQKPTVDVITGLIKSNLPARICFQVSSRMDSRVVIDEMGADKLLGKGDMLFLQPWNSAIIRAQGTYASDDEIRRVVEYIESEPEFAPELVTLGSAMNGDDGSPMERLRSRDELYEQAIEIIVREGRGSTSLLQRALGIGYGRAARLIDFMAEDGIVGNYNGSQAREVMLKPEQWSAMKNGGELQPSA